MPKPDRPGASSTGGPKKPVTVTPIQTLPINIVIPEGFPLTFSNHASIQWTENEVVLSFFQVAAPSGGLEDIQQMQSINAHPVSRIVLTQAFARNFVSLVLQTATNIGVIKMDEAK